MQKPSDAEKPWTGRFSGTTDEFVEAFTASVAFDQRLASDDIAGSIAHATMLAAVGVLTEEERDQIIAGLRAIAADIDAGQFQWSVKLEDVHMNIEAALVTRIGEVGKKLHTARSRNDQVATDLRLFLRRISDTLCAEMQRLMRAIIVLAEQEAATLMPGLTHLQAAQPVSFGHHLLAWFEMLSRDHERFTDCRRRIDRLPLGSGALAGTTFPIDRDMTAQLLGFSALCENSLDAVSDRDFVVEFTACGAMLMMHLSRMAEELILWNSQAFGFIELDDAFCTGSSMMPQKKNPDVPELVRGKAGRIFGHLMGLLSLMKAQPLAYNKDNQEDKEPLFDTVDTLLNSVRAFADLVPTLIIRRDRMRAAAAQGFTTATDLADYLVAAGTPFRDAHAIVGAAVRMALDRDCDLADLGLDDLQKLAPKITAEVFEHLNLDTALAARDHIGGTAPAQVRAACGRARARLQAMSPASLTPK